MPGFRKGCFDQGELGHCWMSGFDLKRAGVRYELGLELYRSFVSECSCEREL